MWEEGCRTNQRGKTRMQFGFRFRALALASVGLFLAAACGTSGTPTGTSILSSYKPVAGVKGGQLVYSDWEPVQDLNVLSSTAATTQAVATGPLRAPRRAFDPRTTATPASAPAVRPGP